MTVKNIFSFKQIISCLAILCLWSGCTSNSTPQKERPIDPWVFRSVLDHKPRMLTIALDSACYVAYDLKSCTLYKVWKGGVTLEGAAYSDRKNVQPTSWGTAYTSENLQQGHFGAEVSGIEDSTTIVNSGYFIEDNQVNIQFDLILASGDTVQITERPEFLWMETGKPALERTFTVSGVPQHTSIFLKGENANLKLHTGKSTKLLAAFEQLPPQNAPRLHDAFDHMGRYWMEKSDCFTCHEIENAMVGPSFRQIAKRYGRGSNVISQLVEKVKKGGTGAWGDRLMNAHPSLTEREVKTMLAYILSLKPKEEERNSRSEVQVVNHELQKKSAINKKPGFGNALEGVHPSYDLTTLHSKSFRPRVGGLVFLPGGELLVTTWDAVGGVYLLEGVETGDPNKIEVKRIASGLAEPLGIEVVDGEIYVLQKHELTHLIDRDGDAIIDEYQAVCNSWGVTTDFHEFAFGLEYKDGFFYATLSLAMRLMANEEQKFDRGRTIKISRDGTYELVNFGLRTPNGVGIGVDDEIFVTDNQGQWVPANKLIHVTKGAYHGMAWGLPKSIAEPPEISNPAIWLPQDEIGNSPAEPILMQDGPYKGQMLHGDVTHGGIKRDFLEKVKGTYQGAVFRFSQGLAAGVNRLCWGPDGALYVGGVGMVGGWSWKGNQYGLQRMKYNNKLTFEMLAIRARPQGFEVEFTEALEAGRELKPEDFFLQQWRYKATSSYGGPKIDLEALEVSRIKVSKARTKVYLEIPGLKKEHVIYFRLSEDLNSISGRSLWSAEAWYTLNKIPG